MVVGEKEREQEREEREGEEGEGEDGEDEEEEEDWDSWGELAGAEENTILLLACVGLLLYIKNWIEEGGEWGVVEGVVDAEFVRLYTKIFCRGGEERFLDFISERELEVLNDKFLRRVLGGCPGEVRERIGEVLVEETERMMRLAFFFFFFFFFFFLIIFEKIIMIQIQRRKLYRPQILSFSLLLPQQKKRKMDCEITHRFQSPSAWLFDISNKKRGGGEI